MRSILAAAGIEGAVGMALVAASLAVMGVAVFFRYVLNDSLGWSEELARYGLVYITFLGAATAARRRTHIRVTFLEDLLPARAVSALRVVQDLLTLAFVAYIALKAAEISSILASTRSAAMQIPMSYVYAAVVAGFTLTALRLVQNLVRSARG